MPVGLASNFKLRPAEQHDRKAKPFTADAAPRTAEFVRWAFDFHNVDQNWIPTLK
jgi:hypothetical protein